MAAKRLNEYITLSRDLIKNKTFKNIRAALVSNFTIQGLAETLNILSHDQGVNLEGYTAPYNQYAQEILNTSSGLYSSRPDVIFLILDSESFLGDFNYFPYRLNETQRKEFITKKFEEFKEVLITLESKVKSKIIINTLLIPPYSSRGILEGKQPWGLRKCIMHFNDLLEDFSRAHSQVFTFDFNVFASKVGHTHLQNNKLKYLGDMKISPPSLVKLAFEYMSYILPLASIIKKCIVLDLDNTLWGGVIGEDGIGHIRLGPEKDGKPFLDFQKRILELSERGIILAINSRNNSDEVLEVMRNHKYMLLKEEHFACMKVNWQDKVTNMNEIANELNIGLESMIFIDDDSTQRELVKSLLPQVFVVDLPVDSSEYAKSIEEMISFNTFSVTDEDLKRGNLYHAQLKRNVLQSEIKDLDSFIKSLGIKMKVIPAEKSNIPRIAQLTQKTNQFNLTTRRYQEEEIDRFSDSPSHIVECIEVYDNLGEYGITGVAIIRSAENNQEKSWELDSFLLSCRILGKNLEFAFMQHIIDHAKKEGVRKIYGQFAPTNKNTSSEKFLNDCGFVFIGETNGTMKYMLEVGKETRRTTHIEVI